jgi:Integrase core domain
VSEIFLMANSGSLCEPVTKASMSCLAIAASFPSELVDTGLGGLAHCLFGGVNEAVRNWLAEMGTKALFVEPGSPWENGYNELFNGKLRDEYLNAELFYTLREAQTVYGMISDTMIEASEN